MARDLDSSTGRLRVPRGRLVLLAFWALGLSALAGVLVLQKRLDERRQAQVAVAELRFEMTQLPRDALDLTGGFTAAQVHDRLRLDEAAIRATAERLDALSGGRSDSALIMDDARPAFAVLDRVAVVAHAGRVQAATGLLGALLLPGAAGSELNAAFDEIDAKYGRQAASARTLADAGSAAAILLLLAAFSFALHRVVALARENRRLLELSRLDALTDDLTGLPNRRKLLFDLNELLGRERGERVALGLFDLDGFKAFNDMFGHPAGDLLLMRLGERLVAAVDGAGTAYRMGGDEFCVIARGDGAETLLERARETLTEHGDGYAVSCSLGRIRLVPGETTAEEAFRRADEQLYDDKRSSRVDERAIVSVA